MFENYVFMTQNPLYRVWNSHKVFVINGRKNVMLNQRKLLCCALIKLIINHSDPMNATMYP